MTKYWYCNEKQIFVLKLKRSAGMTNTGDATICIDLEGQPSMWWTYDGNEDYVSLPEKLGWSINENW